MTLQEYQKKRDFASTTEPHGGENQGDGRRFVVHEHHASRLHFDLRLELGGALKSWAVPKGPSMNPADKHLAVMVEDHPLEYISFRGEIAEGNYGAGQVAIWDSGTYNIVENELDKGKLEFELEGVKLKGRFHLIRLKGKQKDWLLIKDNDEFADQDWKLEQVIPGGNRRDTQERQHKDAPKYESTGDSDPMPTVISPMLATLVDKPFSDPEWLFEQKFDGYRALAFIEKDKFRFISRRNEDLIQKFPQAQVIPGLVNAETAILDGELVVVDKAGKPSFQLLQNAANSQASDGQLIYYVFDLLYLSGTDLRNNPLIERKDLLQSILRKSDFLRYSDHIIEKGEQLYAEAIRSNLEGVIGKHIRSPYAEKRSRHWLKMKAERRQEVVIAGYTSPRHSRKYFGALVIGVYSKNKLVFAGHVGSGFDDESLKEIFDLLQPLIAKDCPFEVKPKTNEPAVWVRPEIVCEVKFSEWTDEGILRQPVFVRIRADKLPSDAVRDTPKELESVVEPKLQQIKNRVISAEDAFDQENLKGNMLVSIDGVEVSLTNLDKVFWPDEGYTKGDLLRYYFRMREVVLPYLIDRPLILKRFPDGVEADYFYQHNLEETPDFVKQAQITEDDSLINYAVIDSAASLLYITNLACIAQNPFSSRIGSLENPDWIIFDLDPEEASFDKVCEVAMVVKEALDEVGLRAYPKTSGSRGMHIYLPIENIYTHEQAQALGKIVASIAVSRKPEIATTERMKNKRGKAQIYIDIHQNAMGKTIVSPYSVREKPGATVSTPLSWAEVESKPDKNQFTMFTVPERVATIGDIIHDILVLPQKLASPIEGLEEMLRRVVKPS